MIASRRMPGVSARCAARLWPRAALQTASHRVSSAPRTLRSLGHPLVRASELLPAEIANRYESENDRVDGHSEQRRI